MLKVERELRAYLKEVKKNLTGLSWDERRSCLREIESAIRERAADMTEDMDEEEALRKSIESMGDAGDIAGEYSITVFESPTLKTYLLLSLNAAAAAILMVMGSGPAYFSAGYDPIHWRNPSTLETLGTIVIVLAIPSLILFLIQILLPRSIPWLRTYVLLPFLTSLLFGAILVFFIIGDNVVEVILDPRSFFGYNGNWVIDFLLFLGVLIFFPLAAFFFLWFFADTRKYELFVSGKKVRKGDYVRAVMAQLTSLDIATRKCIREELERDIEERMKEIGSENLEKNELYSVLGDPNEMALMLLKSRKPPPEKKVKNLIAVPITLLAGISLVVSLVFSFAVLDLISEPEVTFGIFALLLSFPLLIVSIVIWTNFVKMASHPLKKRDFFVPMIVLTAVAILILSSGLGVALTDDQLSKSTPDSRYTYITSYLHEDGRSTIFWVERFTIPHESLPNRRRVMYKLYLTNINQDGEVVHKQKIWDVNIDVDRDPDLYMTSAGDYLLLWESSDNTMVLKVSKSGDLLDELSLRFSTRTSRFSDGVNETLYTSWMSRTENPGFGFAIIKVYPDLQLVDSWERAFDFNENDEYRYQTLIIGEDEVQALFTVNLDDANYSSVDLKSFSFDYNGNSNGEILLHSDNVTRQHQKDYGNRTYAVVEDAIQIEDGRMLVFVQTGRYVNNTATYNLKSFAYDIDTGTKETTVLYNFTKYGSCDIYLGPVDLKARPQVSGTDGRIFAAYSSVNVDFNSDPQSCYEGYEYNTTGSGIYLAIYDWNGSLRSQSFIDLPVYVAHGLYRMRMVDSGEYLVLSNGGSVGQSPCGQYMCEVSLHQALLDEDGNIVQNWTYETNEAIEAQQLLSFEPVRFLDQRIMGVGEGYQEFEVTAPEIQMQGRDAEMDFLYFGEVNPSTKPEREHLVTPEEVFPDEILQVIVAISATCLAIAVLQTTYLVHRKRKGGSKPRRSLFGATKRTQD